MDLIVSYPWALIIMLPGVYFNQMIRHSYIVKLPPSAELKITRLPTNVYSDVFVFHYLDCQEL